MYIHAVIVCNYLLFFPSFRLLGCSMKFIVLATMPTAKNRVLWSLSSQQVEIIISKKII